MNTPIASTTLPLWLLVAFLIAVVVALIAGILKASTKVGLAEAALTGGSAFVAAMTLCVGVLMAGRLL